MSLKIEEEEEKIETKKKEEKKFTFFFKLYRRISDLDKSIAPIEKYRIKQNLFVRRWSTLIWVFFSTFLHFVFAVILFKLTKDTHTQTCNFFVVVVVVFCVYSFTIIR